MPSNQMRVPFVGRQPQMLSDPVIGGYRAPMVLISPLCYEAIGDELTGAGASNMASGTFPGTNLGVGYPFEIAEPFLVMKVWWQNGTTATTDVCDVAVYTETGGASSRLVGGGGGTASGANVVQELNPTDVLLLPGRYWCVYAQGGVTATPMAFATPAAIMRASGCAQMAAASAAGVLGTTWTPAALTGAVFPNFGIAGRTQVA